MKREIVDEKCECGHLKSEHGPSIIQGMEIEGGHGECQKCQCAQFTWEEFVYAPPSPALK